MDHNMRTAAITDRSVLCRYGDGKQATTDVWKQGERPTPMCDEHHGRSRDRFNSGL